MLTFPSLNSGAIAQYPLPVSYTTPTQVVRFIDGSDQRFAARGKTLRSWNLQLSNLSDGEIDKVEKFFTSLGGQYSLFAFPDPYSGVTVPNCRMGESFLTTDYLAADLASLSLWVLETNG
jgi:hypothetical protein